MVDGRDGVRTEFEFEPGKEGVRISCEGGTHQERGSQPEQAGASSVRGSRIKGRSELQFAICKSGEGWVGCREVCRRGGCISDGGGAHHRRGGVRGAVGWGRGRIRRAGRASRGPASPGLEEPVFASAEHGDASGERGAASGAGGAGRGRGRAGQVEFEFEFDLTSEGSSS